MTQLREPAERGRIMGAMYQDVDKAMADLKFRWWQRLAGIPKLLHQAYCLGWLDGNDYADERHAKQKAVPVRPYLGQRVLYHLTNKPGYVPMAAIVCQVHSGVEVSVVAFTPEGVPLSPAATHVGYVPNHQEWSVMPGHFCVPIPEEQP